MGWCSRGRGTGGGTGKSSFCQRELPAGGVEIKDFRVTTPLDGGLELTAGFVLAEVFVQQVLEELGGKSAVRLGFEGLFHLAQKRNVGQHRFAKNGFAFLNVALRECLALRSNDGGALVKLEQAKEHGGVDRRQQGI